jgi:Matrixin/Abnormal spindle-like microcephaly-assoc'd, ASPM-SPD-2-Hydin
VDSRFADDQRTITTKGSRVLRQGLGCAFGLMLACFGLGAIAQPVSLQADLAVGPVPGARGDDAKFRFSFDPIAAWSATMFWHYNPAGAPAQFSDPAAVAAAMQQAIGKWAAACSVPAAYAGMTGIPPESTVGDAENGSMPDQVNVVGWKATPSGISGYTVAFPGYAESGVTPIVDADVVVDPAKLPGIAQLTRLLVHEFGHAIGVSHSQFDSTLMSGPPYSYYNTLDALTDDDVRACRCLYGPPAGVSTGLLCTIPPLVDFGNLEAGTSSQRTFQIANNGNAAITISSVAATPSAYQTSGCGPGTTLHPAASCTMTVTFAPAAGGDHGGAVSFGVGEATPYRIRLVGSASGGASSPFVASPSSVDFGTVPVSAAATTQRVRFKNNGATAVTIASLMFEGAQANEFARSGQCKAGLSVTPGSSCTVDIGFTPSVTGMRTAQFVVVGGDGGRTSIPIQGAGGSVIATPDPSPAVPATVVEFYRSASDHYFITIAPDEIAALDTGLFQGWARTGLTFKAYATSQSGYSPICRFYLPPPADSHFYSASPAECAAVASQNPSFILESTSVMHLAVPNPISGVCPAGAVPIYRAWNRRADTNHRYTTDIAVRDAMVALGHIAEGSGPDAVTFCGPQ